MSLHFYSYARKGYEFIDEVAVELNTTDTDKIGRMIRCVLRALRNRLTFEESFGLLAQLPMALKAVYVDGWKPEQNLLKMNQISDFISEVVKEDYNSAWRDFSGEVEVSNVIIAVFKVLIHHISNVEAEIVLQVLPMDLQSILSLNKAG
jgi:uncharacterized protein (DUF2267 family)